MCSIPSATHMHQAWFNNSVAWDSLLHNWVCELHLISRCEHFSQEGNPQRGHAQVQSSLTLYQACTWAHSSSQWAHTQTTAAPLASLCMSILQPHNSLTHKLTHEHPVPPYTPHELIHEHTGVQEKNHSWSVWSLGDYLIYVYEHCSQECDPGQTPQASSQTLQPIWVTPWSLCWQHNKWKEQKG